MKIHKKEIAVILALVLLLGGLTFPARIRAAEGDSTESTENTESTQTPANNNKGKIEITRTDLSSMAAGTEFKVQIHIHSVDSFAGLEGTLAYDKKTLAVSTGSAISVSPKGGTKNTPGWKASLAEGADTDTLSVNWEGTPAPTDSEKKLAENQGLVVSIPFKLTQDSRALELSVTLKDVTIFTDTEDKTQKYKLEDTNIGQLTIKAQKLKFEFGQQFDDGKEEIRVPIYIRENTGVSGFTIRISCVNPEDSSKLNFYRSKQEFADGAKNKYSIPAAGKDKELSWENGGVTIQFITTGMQQEKEPYTGEFFILTLNATDAAHSDLKSAREMNIPLKLEVTEVLHRENTVPFIREGTETSLKFQYLEYTKGYVYKDASGGRPEGNPSLPDGLSLRDILWIMRAADKENPMKLDEAQRKAADVLEDGKIDLGDATKLLQFYNGEIASL